MVEVLGMKEVLFDVVLVVYSNKKLKLNFFINNGYYVLYTRKETSIKFTNEYYKYIVYS